MWEVHGRDIGKDDYQVLTSAISPTNDGIDSDTTTIASVSYGVNSYQSTSYIITHGLSFLTSLLLVLTCATLGASIASPNKKLFGIQGIMPSVTVASGNCDQLKYANYTLHLVTNCIGTIIIACSNYLQQSTLLFFGSLMKYARVRRSKT